MPATALSADLNCGLLCFPAPQRELLIIQMLVARLLGVGNFSLPPLLFQECFKAENGIFIKVVPVDMVGIFDQVDVFDVPPHIAITDMGNVPGGRVSSGHSLTQFNYLAHECTSRTKEGDLPK